MEVLAIIPARKGSKRIPGKNLKKLGGRPLLEYSSESALSSKNIDRVILSTDDIKIKKLGIKLGLEAPFLRSKKLAQDDTPTLPVIQDLLKRLFASEKYKPDLIILLQTTSPFRTSKDIDEAIKIFKNQNADSLVSTIKVPHNMNPYSIMKLSKNRFIEPFLEYNELDNISQKKPIFYARNGAAIYISSYECIMNKNSMYGDKIINYEMPKERSIDLDDFYDWKIAELLLQNE